MKWDYHVVELDEQVSASHIQDILKVLEEEEWELDVIDRQSNRILLILKQELKEPKPDIKLIIHPFEPKKDDDEPVINKK